VRESASARHTGCACAITWKSFPRRALTVAPTRARSRQSLATTASNACPDTGSRSRRGWASAPWAESRR
jgi:hypothetical protein